MAYINMKKLFAVIFTIVLMPCMAQNTYDTYNPYNGSPFQIIPSYNVNQNPGYTGEYQIFMDRHTWWTSPSGFNNNNYISYKIEPISFPFYPDCSTGDCENSNSTSRKCKMAPNFGLNFGIFSSQFGIQTLDQTSGNQNMSELQGLAGNGFTVLNYENGGGRIVFPHTVLKHTFYIHCNGNSDSPIIDEFSFIVDHTRGRMRYYPFRPDNGHSAEGEHDVTIIPFFIHPTCPNNEYYCGQQGNLLGTIDFFPLLNISLNACNTSLAPTTPGDLLTDYNNFIHPAPYSLVSFVLGDPNEGKFAGYNYPTSIPTPGIEQQYTINVPINLRLINPAEKVIYNPSEVTIGSVSNPITLTFPSGYTFRTTYGRYPTEIEVQNTDPYNLYSIALNAPINASNTLSNNITTAHDERKSIYYIAPGCTLNVEACVNIYDAEIVLQPEVGNIPGGVIVYDPAQTYLVNTTIINQWTQGTGINQITLPFGNCSFNCYNPSNFQYLGGNLPWLTGNVTIDVNNYQNYFPTATNNTIKIGSTLTIPQGVTLTIGAGMRLEFGENAKLIVLQDAKLISNGALNNPVVFTSACDKMWKGIEVQTDGSFLQFAVHCGILDFNYTEIENAHTAIVNGKPDVAAPYGGGIIKLNNCVLRNNGKGIDFLPFTSLNFVNLFTLAPYPDLSNIQNCTFETTKPLLDAKYYSSNMPKAQDYFIGMQKNFYINVSNCTFRNTAIDPNTNQVFVPHLRGTGIRCFDTWIKLNDGANASTFSGLSEGMWASSSGIQSFTKINGNVFTNNIHAIVMEGSQNSAIFSNTITVPPSPLYGYSNTALERGYDKPVGIYLIGSYGYRVEENLINVNAPAAHTGNAGTGEQCTYGIVVNNTVQTLPNGNWIGTGSVYKNNIQNLSIGLQAEGDNGSGLVNGLDVKCNFFDNLLFYDFVATGRGFTQFGPPPITGILKDQGLCVNGQPQLQAGNGFDACVNNQNDQFLFGSNMQIGLMYKDQAALLPISCTNTPSSLIPCQLSIGQNQCSSLIGTCGIPCLSDLEEISTERWASADSNYHQLVDGGNTQALLNTVYGTMSAGQLKNLLMQRSPYLSDTILIAMLSRNNPLPPGHIKQIVVANSPVTAKVMDKLNTINLPDGILNQINAAQQGISARYLLEAEINAYLFDINKYKADIISYCLENSSFDTLTTVIIGDTVISPEHSALPLLTAMGHYHAADSLLGVLAAGGCTYGNCAVCNTEHIFLELVRNQKWLYDLTPQEVQFFANAALSNPDKNIQQRTVLQVRNKYKFARDPYPLSGGNNNNKLSGDYVNTIDTESFTIFPNPSENTVSVQVNLADTNKNAVILLYDFLGKQLKQYTVTSENSLFVVDNSELKNGVYLLQLVVDGKAVESKKMVIIK